MKFKLYIPSIFLVLLFHASFITLPYLNNYYNLKYIILLIVGIYLIFRYNTLKRCKFQKINVALMMYLIMVVISSYTNRFNVLSRNVFLSSIVFVVVILEVFLLFEYFYIKGRTKTLIKTLFYLILIYIIITDVIMIIFPTLHVQKGMYYFIGNKFNVSYLHLQLIVLYLQKHSYERKMRISEKATFALLCLLTLFICIYVECSTGVVGLFLLLMLFFVEKKYPIFLKKPKIFFITLFISCSTLLLFSGILKVGVVKYFIEQILHEDITLTGRMIIYSKIDSILANHLLLGYGSGSSFDIIMNTIGAPNTQNGVLEVILEQGLISFFLMMLLAYLILKKNNGALKSNYSVIMVYVLVVLSSIEITLDTTYIIWLSILLICNPQNNNT